MSPTMTKGPKMSASCCDHCHDAPARKLRDKIYRRVLWAVLAINAAMFAVEIGAGMYSGSASLLADSLDFLGDAANYAIGLFVVGMALNVRARASLVKALSMVVFGLWVLGVAAWNLYHGTVPHAPTMGIVGISALIANVASFGLLWRFRDGDSNMRSAWICTRNDVLGNFAVMLAALGVFGTGTGLPDVAVAAIMGGLALQGSVTVARQALAELKSAPAAAE
jgi:Co/Zn/Cd efflux system component